MAAELVKELIDAGVHFGHRASKWNPKMKPFIFGRRNLIHIIDLKETLRGILASQKFITRTVSQGKEVLYVGTKRQARKAVQEAAEESGMHWIDDRWLGGTLTNFREIRKRIARMEELEQLESEGMLDAYSKKQGAALRRELKKMQRNLGGLRNMKRMPGVMVVVDQKREVIAIREARKLGIPVICLLDTDSDPDMVDIAIPGNDDAMKAISLIIKTINEAVKEGINHRKAYDDQQDEDKPRRRSRRETTARADDEEGDDSNAPEESDTPRTEAADETPTQASVQE